MTHHGHSTALDDEARRRLDTKLRRELGVQVNEWLQDPAVIEIMLNPDGTLWVERLGQRMEKGGAMAPSTAMALMGTVAALHNTVVNHQSPILECPLPFDGSRFEGLLPPLVKAPTFAIRRPAVAVFSLADYVAKGILRPDQHTTLRAAITQRRNILVVGGTSSGKTTLLNACIAETSDVAPFDRLAIIEDTPEIQCASANFVRLQTAETADMTRLLKATMRLRPERIIVGEVRDCAALALLKAWNTGHPGGLSTLHANSAQAGLKRLEQLAAEGTSMPQPHLIAEAVNIVVFIAKTPEGGREVREIIAVDDFDGQKYITHPL